MSTHTHTLPDKPSSKPTQEACAEYQVEDEKDKEVDEGGEDAPDRRSQRGGGEMDS